MESKIEIIIDDILEVCEDYIGITKDTRNYSEDIIVHHLIANLNNYSMDALMLFENKDIDGNSFFNTYCVIGLYSEDTSNRDILTYCYDNMEDAKHYYDEIAANTFSAG